MEKIAALVVVTVLVFGIASISLAADCPRALGNLCEDPSVEKLTDEEVENIRAPMSAPKEKKQTIKEFVGKRFLMSPPIH